MSGESQLIYRFKHDEVWDMWPDETSHTYALFLQYRDMNPNLRSARILADQIGTIDKFTLQRYSHKFKWADRCKAWDSYLAKIREAEIAAKVAEVAQLEYANWYGRVAALNDVAIKLKRSIDDNEDLWIEEERISGVGRNQVVTSTRRFNNQLVSEFRGTLGDIAAEVGERVQRREDNIKIRVEQMSDEQLLQLIEQGVANVGLGGSGSQETKVITEGQIRVVE